MSLRDAIAALPDEAMVPVGWIREQLGSGSGSDALADLTVEQAAEKLSKAPSTVRAWLIAGELRGYKIHGREWRISPTAIVEFFDDQKNGSGRQAVRSRGQQADLGEWKQHLKT